MVYQCNHAYILNSLPISQVLEQTLGKTTTLAFPPLYLISACTLATETESRKTPSHASWKFMITSFKVGYERCLETILQFPAPLTLLPS